MLKAARSMHYYQLRRSLLVRFRSSLRIVSCVVPSHSSTLPPDVASSFVLGSLYVILLLLRVIGNAPELFIELCPYIFSRCNTTPEDEAAAWALLESHEYTAILQHHDAGATMPKLPPEAVRLDGLKLPPEFEAEYEKMSHGSYARARQLVMQPSPHICSLFFYILLVPNKAPS